MERRRHRKDTERDQVKGLPILKLAVFAVLVSCISILLSVMIYNNFYIVEVKSLPMDIEVKQIVGLNVDTDAIHFGGTRPGGRSERSIIVSHSQDFPVRLTIRLEGFLKDYVIISENDLVLLPGESQGVTFWAYVPEDMPTGNYTGTAIFEFKRKIG